MARQSQRYEIGVHRLKFELSIIWPDADVDAAITPMLSALCGHVIHKVSNASRTPKSNSVDGLIAWLMMQKGIFPESVNVRETYDLCQGFASLTFEYDGELADLGATIEECKKILSRYVSRYVRYYKAGDTERNSRVNVYRGTGSAIRRIA
jgi:hypothetical protein